MSGAYECLECNFVTKGDEIICPSCGKEIYLIELPKPQPKPTTFLGMVVKLIRRKND